jgi:FtsP/CotA-like multicopper oxidase with cupredoxin domain
MLKAGALGSAAVALPLQRIASTKGATRLPANKLPKPFTLPFVTPPEAVPTFKTETTDYYAMSMRQEYVDILPGYKTMIWGYEGTAPGPTIRVHRGRDAVVRHCNELPATHPTLGYENWTSVHLHGSCSLPQYDGYASDITRKSQYKDYKYPNCQDARTLWYHDHGIHHTAENAYMGLAGMYIMHDELEQSLAIPHGKYDVPFILRDALFDVNGQLLYQDNSRSSVHGDVLLVNGVPWPTMKVEKRTASQMSSSRNSSRYQSRV